MPFDDTPNKLDAVFVQRDGENQYYEQINISASNAIVYLNEQGKIDVSRISDFMATWGGGGGSTDTASYVPFNGNRAITRQDPDFEGLNVGGTNVVDFLNNFFFPFNEATIFLNSPAPTSNFETGSIQNPVLTGTITDNSETFFGTGSLRDQYTASAFPYGATFNVTDINVSSSKTYTAHLQVNSPQTIISSNSRTINFYFPYLWGVDNRAGLDGTDLYNACTRTPQTNNASQTVNGLVGTDVYIYFAYPSGYPALSRIEDPQGFDTYGPTPGNVDDWEHSASVSVTSTGLSYNWTANYRVYRLKLPASPNGTFHFYQ